MHLEYIFVGRAGLDFGQAGTMNKRCCRICGQKLGGNRVAKATPP